MFSPRKSQLVDGSGNPLRSMRRERYLKARYDAAQWTKDNSDYWTNADTLAPNASNDPAVRSRLRSRSRYECVENNSYLKGMVLTLANDFTCSGARVHFTDKRLSRTAAQELEARFNLEYAKRINLRQILWQLRHAKCVDGEGFAVQYTDYDIPEYEVQTNWQVVEAEQCQLPLDMTTGISNRGYTDGMRIDRYGRTRAYYMLYNNPGENYYWTADPYRGRWINAEYVLHWTRKERPWARGIPETTPALPLCAYLRRYNLAVLAAAETAASFAGVLQSKQPAYTGTIDFSQGGGEESDYEPFDNFPIERGMFTNLPDGYELSQLRAEQPTENHDKFVDTVLREIARCLNIPFNIAVGFSGGYNLASGTLDRQLYNGSIARERESAEQAVLRKVISEWWFEANRIPGYLSSDFNELLDVPQHVWMWDQTPEHADPQKNAMALKTLWDAGFITDEQVQMGRFARDPEEHYDSLQRQAEHREKLGMPLPGVQQVTQTSDNTNGSQDDNQDDNQEDQDQEDQDQNQEQQTADQEA